jgi:hypothetical protein
MDTLGYALFYHLALFSLSQSTCVGHLHPVTRATPRRSAVPVSVSVVTHGLSRLIQKAVENDRLEELKICHQAPRISHFLFADHSLLFFKGSVEQATVVKNTLDS